MFIIDTRDEKFKIRFANEKDTPTILKFIKGLAEHEGELDEVVATEEILMYSLFEQKSAEVIIGEYEGHPVGFALFHNNYSTFLGRSGIHLVDLYIIPDMRRKGFGTIILSYLANLAVERHCGRLEWWCHDWNKSAIKFYKKIGAYPLDNLTTYRLFGKKLKNFTQEHMLKT